MKKIAVIGAGQLGLMLGEAGKALDLECIFLDPADNPPAAAVGEVLKFPFASRAGLAQLTADTDLVTYEFENVPVAALCELPKHVTVYPPAQALHNAQDRFAEKQLFRSIGIPVPDFRTVDSEIDLLHAADAIGLPLVLKTRRLGYDGKGQKILHAPVEFADAILALGGADLIAEQWVAFERELSIIGSRSVSGQIAIFPLSENEHSNGILKVSRAPAQAGGLEVTAERYLTDLLQELDYVGTLALELFVVDGRLLANEFAPRVHNSGHWTIEGAETSQFENHLRAILDLPLGDPGMQGFAGMLNLIGRMPDRPLHDPEANIFLHDYGKSSRPGRKLGHLTVVADSADGRDGLLDQLAEKTSSCE